MPRLIDDFAKALAAGQSRRRALGRLGAGLLAAVVPGRTVEAHDRFARCLDDCRKWCRATFGDGRKGKKCIERAKDGKGPCYSSSKPGPGHLCCTQANPCGANEKCCADVLGGPSSAECCPSGTECIQINGTNCFG